MTQCALHSEFLEESKFLYKTRSSLIKSKEFYFFVCFCYAFLCIECESQLKHRN